MNSIYEEQEVAKNTLQSALEQGHRLENAETILIIAMTANASHEDFKFQNRRE